MNSFRIVFWALIRHIQDFFEREKELTGKPGNTQEKHELWRSTDVNRGVRCQFHRGTGLSMLSS